MSLEFLESALGKVSKRVPADQFTLAEVEALKLWMGLNLAFKGKETRAERSQRNKRHWQSGDRSAWGGERRKRDPRRGWRNFSRP